MADTETKEKSVVVHDDDVHDHCFCSLLLSLRFALIRGDGGRARAAAAAQRE